MVYGEEERQNSEMMADDAVGKKILDTAIAIVSREGYDNLTIRKVAKESGCSNSAIYQHFGDKNALAEAAATLQTKPFLVLMDETYSKDFNFFTNLDRITKKLLEKLYSYEQGALYMKIIYQGPLGVGANPFIRRVEAYLNNAMTSGEIKNTNIKETAFLIVAFFLGLIQMVRSNENIDLQKARKLLEVQNRMIYHGIGSRIDEDSLWDQLRERGVNVDKALERMKGNKEAYRSFLVEFFEDADFQALKEEIKAGNAQNAFEYAHGLKGMAANLGIDEVQQKLGVLVEILRYGSLEGAAEAYEDVITACSILTALL